LPRQLLHQAKQSGCQIVRLLTATTATNFLRSSIGDTTADFVGRYFVTLVAKKLLLVLMTERLLLYVSAIIATRSMMTLIRP